MSQSYNVVICSSGLEAGALGRDLLERHPEQRTGSFLTRTQDFLILTPYATAGSYRSRRILILPTVDREDVNFKRAFHESFMTRLLPGAPSEPFLLERGDYVEQIMQFAHDDTGLPGYVPKW